MTSGQRRTLGVVAVAVLLLAAVLAVAQHRGARTRADRAAVDAAARRAAALAAPALEVTTTAPSGPTTTFALVPFKTGVPVPDATEAPPATEPPSATPAPPRNGAAPPPSGGAAPSSAPSLTSAGALLAAPANPGPARTIDKAKGCYSAADAGWNVTDCGALKTKGLVLLWVVEGKGPGLRALVLQEQTADQWSVVLLAADDAGTAFSRIGVHGDDVSGDGQPDLAFGFHRRTVDKVLAVDVVEGPGAVTLHRDLPNGAVQTAPGQLDTWTADAAGARHDVVRFVSGAWRVMTSEAVAPGSVPASAI